MITSLYHRFAEISNKSQKVKNVSLIFGKSEIEKTRSSQHYYHWHIIEPLPQRPAAIRTPPSCLLGSIAAVYTPDVTVTPCRLQASIASLRNEYNFLMEQTTYIYSLETAGPNPHRQLKLLIIDEAYRLDSDYLELLRDLYDRSSLSILLIGAPGIDRRLQRAGYSQLHSRFDFVYQIKSMSKAEMRLFIEQKWLELKLPLIADDTISSAIMRLGDENFRRLNTIFGEVSRLQKLNCLPMITPDLLETARRSLLTVNQSLFPDFSK